LQHQQAGSLPPGVYQSTTRGLVIAEVHGRRALGREGEGFPQGR
jgi:hypothetical protein